MPRKPCKIFTSYAHEAADSCRKLMRLLRAQMAASAEFEFLFWDDRMQLEPEELQPAVVNAISACDFGLLLIGPQYVTSEMIVDVELPHFLNELPKPAFVVEVSGGTVLDETTKGLAQLNPFRDGKRPFQICTGRQQKLFVQKLCEELEAFAKTIVT